jgi:hypothetical protein
MGLLLLATAVAGGRSLRAHGVVGVLVTGLAWGTVAFVLLDVLALERDALRVTHRVVTPEVAPRQLRLVDLNVLHGYDDFPRQEERAERTVAALAALEPDILVLQEAWRTRRHGDLTGHLAEALQMDAAYARANGKLERIGFEEGEAILSRFRVTHFDCHVSFPPCRRREGLNLTGAIVRVNLATEETHEQRPSRT